jgi:hypothetical protein
VGARHLGPEVQPSKIWVRRVVAGTAELVLVVQKHRAAIASMCIVTVVATVFQCRVSTRSIGPFSDLRVTGEAEFTTISFQQSWTISKVGIVAPDTAALSERGVHHRVVITRHVTVARLTQRAALLQQAYPGAARLSVARFARSFLERGVLRDAP